MNIVPNTLHENLRNLAARALAGEWTTHAELSNQVLRLWRGADFEPLQGEPMRLTAEERARLPMLGKVDPDASSVAVRGVSERKAKAPSCPESRRHSVMKRAGEACACGYNAQPAEVKG